MPKKVQSAGRPDKRKKKAAFRPAPVASPVTPQAGAMAVPVASTSATAPSRSAWAAAARSASRGANTIRTEDYRYIYGDLRRIGMLAGSIFVVLIALSFILR